MSLLFSFAGRIGRGKFWMGSIIVGLLMIAATAAYGAAITYRWETFGGPGDDGSVAPYFLPALITYSVFMLVLSFMAFAVMAKRFHDRGQTGWWVILAILPFAASLGAQYLFDDMRGIVMMAAGIASLGVSIFLLVNLGLLEGDEGPNRFGPEPSGRQRPA